MRKLLIISILLFVRLNGFGQGKNDKEIISSPFMNNDSISVQISYTETPNCVEAEYGLVLLFIKNDSVHVSHRLPKTQNIESFSIYNKLAYRNVINFEKTGKKIKPCGGYAGGNGVEVTLKINGSKTKFSYCKDTWNGIKELISKIKK